MGTAAPLDKKTFAAIAREYRRRFGFALVCVNRDGLAVHGRPPRTPCSCGGPLPARLKQAVAETLRWGEPTIDLCCPDGFAMWAAPLMRNAVCEGGLVVAGVRLEGRRGKGVSRSHSETILAASRELLRLLEERNLTNPALLKLHRLESERQRERAEALHALKTYRHDDLREIYLREEPALLAAIKRGDRPAAREVINRVLVAVYHHGRDRIELRKSLILELVIMMCRAAVEAGGEPTQILGMNYALLSRLDTIRDDEALTSWLVSTLERLLDAIRDNTRYPHTVLLGKALDYVEEHLERKLRRDEVARHAGLSPSHFSRLIKEKTGRSFQDLLAAYRVDRARELLVRTDKNLVQVALECGFCDQSYFTKVFQKRAGVTPGDYRRQHRRNGNGGA